MIEIGSVDLTVESAGKVVFENEQIVLSKKAISLIERAADYVSIQAKSGTPVYGVTTGFGANRDQVIDPKDARQLQEKLILSHACGVGQNLCVEAVRAMMLFRINALSQGYSGITHKTLNILVEMLNKGVHPEVPEIGSVGASGDLCPLAHMCLPIIGYGSVTYKGETRCSKEVFAEVGIKQAELTFKEGLALLNGTQAHTGVGFVALHKFRALLDISDLVGAMSLEAVAGRTDAFDPRIQTIRRRKGQIESAKNVLQCLEGSELANIGPDKLPGKTEYVQDSYCLRCLPQVHGACRDVYDYVAGVIETEMNAVTDNPVVFVPSEGGGVLSGGNFHGEPVAMALDYLKIAIAEIGSISERRSAKLTDKKFSEGLPAFLVKVPGLNSGMMIPQYVAAALVTDNKTRGFPSSMDSIPTSANMEDHVSMGMHSANHCLSVVVNVTRILSIEYLIAGQGLDLREGFKIGSGTKKALELLRQNVPFLEEDDHPLHQDIEKAEALLASGQVSALARAIFS